MIRVFAIGLWVCVVAFGSLYATLRNQSPSRVVSGVNIGLGGLDYVKTDVMSVPVMTSGAVAGYVVVQLVYTIDAKIRAKLTVPLEYFINDEIFRQFYGSYNDTRQVEKVQFETIRQSLVSGINERFPEPVIKDLLVEQFNYISADEIRAMNMQQGIGDRVSVAEDGD